MAKNDSIDLKQDRRQWLKTSATVLGASLLPLPPVAAQSSRSETAPPVKPAGHRTAARFFTPAQHTLV